VLAVAAAKDSRLADVRAAAFAEPVAVPVVAAVQMVVAPGPLAAEQPAAVVLVAAE